MSGIVRGVIGAVAGLFLGIAVFVFMLNGAPTEFAKIRLPGMAPIDRENFFQGFAIPLIITGALIGAIAAIIFGGKLWTQRIRYTTWGVLAGVALAVIGSHLVAMAMDDRSGNAVDLGRQMAPLFGFLGGAAGTFWYHLHRRRRADSPGKQLKS